MPHLSGSIADASEYWIARWSLSSGAHSRDPVAGDDGREHDAFAFNDSHRFNFQTAKTQGFLRSSLRAKRSNPYRNNESKSGLLHFARNDGKL
jgi:hypothetical protein